MAPPCGGNCGTLPRLLAAVAFDMLAVGLIVPLITPFTRELGASPSTIGLLSSVYGATQLVSSPVLGRLSDKLSRRTILLWSLVGGACGYLVLGFANAIWMVVLSRFVVGIFRQTLTVSKAWVADLGTREERGRNLSYFYSTVSLGFMVGPALGGRLAAHESMGFRFPFILASCIFVVIAVVVYATLPEGKVVTVHPQAEAAAEASARPHRGWMEEFASLRPAVRNLMVLRFFIGCAVMLSRQGVFMLLEFRHAWDVTQKGLIISLFSTVSVVAQLFIAGPVTKAYSGRAVTQGAAAVLVVAQASVALASDIRIFFAGIVVLAAATAVLKTAMSNNFTLAAGEDARGEVLGVAGSVMSVSRALAPLVTGVLTEIWDSSAPGLVASMCMCVVVVLSPVFVPRHKKQQRAAEEGEGDGEGKKKKKTQ